MRKKTIIYDPTNFSRKGVMAGTVYGKGNYKIRKTKIIEKGGKVVKKVDYGPVNYLGKQTKTKIKY